jgi:hypothetical protein
MVSLERHRWKLDFGYGCGRVLRHYNTLAGSSQFYGTDDDDEATSWHALTEEWHTIRIGLSAGVLLRERSALPHASATVRSQGVLESLGVGVSASDEIALTWLFPLPS